MLEKEVEDHLVGRAEDAGGEAYKFTVPGRRGTPDRLVLLPVAPEHRSIVARYVRFYELKRPGKDATVQQKRWRDRLREMGFRAEVLSSKVAVNQEEF